MPRREWKLYVQDILQAIAKIERFTAGMNLASFTSDEKTVDAVLRNIAVIGEAARHVPEDVQRRHPAVPWAEMRAIRNIVVHEYFGVSLPILWNTVTSNLPPLIPLLEEVLHAEG